MTPQRKTYLKRSTKPLKRTRIKSSRKRIPTRRKDPARRAFAKHRVKPFTDWIKTLACTVTKLPPGGWTWDHLTVDPAHIIPRSRGAGDLFNVIPLERFAHETQHRIGWPAFEKKYGIDAKKIATELTEQWLQTPCGQAWAHQEEP